MNQQERISEQLICNIFLAISQPEEDKTKILPFEEEEVSNQEVKDEQLGIIDEEQSSNNHTKLLSASKRKYLIGE